MILPDLEGLEFAELNEVQFNMLLESERSVNAEAKGEGEEIYLLAFKRR